MFSLAAFWRRRGRELSQLNLWKLLQKHGTRRIAARQPDALVRAVESCRACRQPDKCDTLLAAAREVEIEAFCPNVMYLRHLVSMQRHEPKRALLESDA